jgi:hypothetical protein
VRCLLDGESHVGDGCAGHPADVQPPAEFAVGDPAPARGDEAAEHDGEAGARAEAGDLAELQTVPCQEPGEFRGLDEHVPVVDVGVDDAGQRPVLHQLDRNQPASRCAVDGVEQVEATGLEHPRRLADHPVRIGHVLQHVTAVREVVSGIRDGQLLTGPDPVVDAQSTAGRVGAGGLDRRRRRVDSGHPAAQGGELFGEEPAAAANVECPQPARRDAPLPGEHVTEVGEPAGGDSVQEAQRAALVPPGSA